jgi:hypothetical protein
LDWTDRVTYQEPFGGSCCELGVNLNKVEKVRKLPHKKGQRCCSTPRFHRLELVLIIRENNFLFRNAASALTERPCCNRRDSKLMY